MSRTNGFSPLDRWLSPSDASSGPTNTLILEDPRGGQTARRWFLDWRDYEHMVTLRGNEAFLSPRRQNEPGLLSNGNGFENLKIFLVRQAMRDLSLWYEEVFRQQEERGEEDDAEKQLFFNSNLIQFIAATDDNEDTVGHSQFVAAYTLLLAREAGIEDSKFLIDLERGALLHDIGKIGIPDSILKKKGSLTIMEREIIKDHPLLGFKLLEEFVFLERAARVVLYHHEHYDGQGYPYGLAGEDIPLEARLFSLADTLDAMTSDRPYRKSRSFEEARDEIERHSGSQFDPDLVEIFLAVPKERWQRVKLETLRTLRLPLVH